MADLMVVAKVLVWVCGVLVYFGAIGLLSAKRMNLRGALPFLLVGAAAFLLGTYYLGGLAVFLPLLLLVCLFTAIRLRPFRASRGSL